MNGHSEVVHRNINLSWWILKISYGLAIVVIGADKFFNMITYWSKYVSLPVLKIVPLDVVSILMIVAVTEIIVGLMILTIFTRLGSYIAIAWLAIIVINLLSIPDMVDIAARDVLIALALYVLILLDSAKEILAVEHGQQYRR